MPWYYHRIKWIFRYLKRIRSEKIIRNKIMLGLSYFIRIVDDCQISDNIILFLIIFSLRFFLDNEKFISCDSNKEIIKWTLFFISIIYLNHRQFFFGWHRSICIVIITKQPLIELKSDMYSRWVLVRAFCHLSWKRIWFWFSCVYLFIYFICCFFFALCRNALMNTYCEYISDFNSISDCIVSITILMFRCAPKTNKCLCFT